MVILEDFGKRFLVSHSRLDELPEVKVRRSYIIIFGAVAGIFASIV